MLTRPIRPILVMSVSMLIPVHWKKNLVLASMVFPFSFPTRRTAMVIHRVMVPKADKANTRNENSLTSVLKNLLIGP